MALTYRQLLREAATLAVGMIRATDSHKKMATIMSSAAHDTGQVAEQIAALHVDAATVAETGEVARIMRGLSTSALAYASAADEASRAATAAKRQTATTHAGIKEAADRSPVPMADRTWYTQE